MRKLFQQQMPGVDNASQQVFNEIFKASQDADIVDLGQAFTVNGGAPFTETRTLNVTAPTLANVAAVLATLLLDFQRGGQNRST